MNQIVVTIKKPGVEKKSTAGRPYIAQRAQVQLFDREGHPEELPRMCELITDVQLAPGDYTIDPRSFGVGQYDKLELRRVVLAPVNSQNGGAPGAPAKK